MSDADHDDPFALGATPTEPFERTVFFLDHDIADLAAAGSHVTVCLDGIMSAMDPAELNHLRLRRDRALAHIEGAVGELESLSLGLRLRQPLSMPTKGVQ